MIKLNNKKIYVTVFPDKTSQVWKVGEINSLSVSKFDINWEFEDEGEVFHLIQLVDLLKAQKPDTYIKLTIPYLPYGRQDKEISDTSTFALRSFAKIINSLKLNEIVTLDAHSSVATDLIDNLVDIFPTNEIQKAIILSKANAVAFPDRGAYIRYNERINSIPKIIGDKVRDQQTGYIINFSFQGNVKGRDVLIIDDICDGGMTFRIFAKDLLEAGAKSVDLYVTHGIFSKGLGVLKEAGVSKIFDKNGQVFASPNDP
jgi:ribose-phosphate pyrophosphokinase